MREAAPQESHQLPQAGRALPLGARARLLLHSPRGLRSFAALAVCAGAGSAPSRGSLPGRPGHAVGRARVRKRPERLQSTRRSPAGRDPAALLPVGGQLTLQR